jgi:adenosylcobinamide amidohydrolase
VDHFSLLFEERRKNALVVGVPEEAFPFPRAVSWAVYGGGFSIPRIIVNHSINVNEWIEDGAAYAASFVHQQGFPKESIVMMTAVEQRFQSCADRRSDDGRIALRTYATVGLGNARAAGDPVAIAPKFGTINLIVAIAGTLSDEALLECIAIVTEAKARFLSERRVLSGISGALATGTGTDCVTILSLGVGDAIINVGKHTMAGSLIALAVMDAMAKSLALRHEASLLK